jgi:thioredoxin reductase (NADPH)
METEIPGIFAAGDIRKNSSRQVITAAGDGATAALSAERYLSEQ